MFTKNRGGHIHYEEDCPQAGSEEKRKLGFSYRRSINDSCEKKEEKGTH